MSQPLAAHFSKRSFRMAKRPGLAFILRNSYSSSLDSFRIRFAASQVAVTRFTYPVQRQRFPMRASRTSGVSRAAHSSRLSIAHSPSTIWWKCTEARTSPRFRWAPLGSLKDNEFEEALSHPWRRKARHFSKPSSRTRRNTPSSPFAHCAYAFRNWLRVIGTYETKPLILLGRRFDAKTKTQQSIEIAEFLVSILVAGIGFEPMTFRLWA